MKRCFILLGVCVILVSSCNSLTTKEKIIKDIRNDIASEYGFLIEEPEVLGDGLTVFFNFNLYSKDIKNN